ncbi:ISXO2 transposase-like protein [Thiocapsa rosea]|uniref:ISXO2 transposase-like protein n=1 Tax=Thiocapsa rosea TaxID=69360 RepID=A0A495VBD8_9GAMM|nr:ISXO2 transposase-like protein [Thiocapsa rosea]
MAMNRIQFQHGMSLFEHSLNDHGHPLRAKFTQLPGFTRTAIAAWAGANLAPTSTVISDGLACFAGVTDIGCAHQPTVVGTRKPKDLPMFRWVNTVLGNLKTSFSGAYHSFDFGKYAARYLGAIAYRFNRRFDLHALPARLLVAATACGPAPNRGFGAWRKLLANQVTERKLREPQEICISPPLARQCADMGSGHAAWSSGSISDYGKERDAAPSGAEQHMTKDSGLHQSVQ